MRVRFESFGGVLHNEKPAFTAFVDKKYMRKLGFVSSPLWETTSTILSAPLEAHFNIATRCPERCAFCYSAGSNQEGSPHELSTAAASRHLAALARLGVFTVAFGGGEPLTRSDLFELAAEARWVGLTPSMTTNGLLLDSSKAKSCRVFSHVHLSLDLEREDRPGLRPSFAERVSLLREQDIDVGVNIVVTRTSYLRLEEAARLLRSLRLSDVLFLRFKPKGRGAALARELDLTPEQARGFLPLVGMLERRYRLSPKGDCSLLPMVCSHGVDPHRLEFFASHGCQAGNHLISVDARGVVFPCSFSQRPCGTVDELAEQWAANPELQRFRAWTEQAAEPCRGCAYLSVCRGGCRVVAEVMAGDFAAPDPACPVVHGSA